MGKVIHGELCKTLKFDHINKLNMHKAESHQENETNKILWYFEMQLDRLNPSQKANLVLINKKKELVIK